MANETVPTFCAHRNRSFEYKRRRTALFSVFAAAVAVCSVSSANAGLKYPGDFTAEAKLKTLAKKVGAQAVPVQDTCVDPGPKAATCKSTALDRTMRRLKAGKRVRILQLGDSHIAADYITGMIRSRLQAKYGDGGRGFMHIDQSWGFGGRKTRRKDSAWKQTRLVDKYGPGKPFGFSGMSIVAKKKGAKASYRVLPGDEVLRVYYRQQPKGGSVRVVLQGKEIGEFSSQGADETKVFEVKLSPSGSAPKQKRGPAGWSLDLIAGKGTQLFGLSFDKSGDRGVIYESVGPVGADAKVYLDAGRKSFVEHLKIHAPDVVVLMVGGNDALKSRKKWTDLTKVRAHHDQLLDLLKSTLPNVEILIWAPMDAGDKKRGKVTSKALLTDVRDLQKAVAQAKGAAFWDTLEAMGGTGAITKWHKARLMNKDLVHPKKRAADLLGMLFADALSAL